MDELLDPGCPGIYLMGPERIFPIPGTISAVFCRERRFPRRHLSPALSVDQDPAQGSQ